MISLITNETDFAVKFSHQAVHSANHNQNMFDLSMAETTSQGSFDLDQMKHVKMGDVCGEEGVLKRSKVRDLMFS